MRFKKGDRVWMVGKNRRGISVPSMRGVVVGINDYHYDPPKMMVLLVNGDKGIQDVEESFDSIVSFNPDFRGISSTG